MLQKFKSLIAKIYGYDVFISYAHKDGVEYANSLSKALESKPKSLKTFLDVNDFNGGDHLPDETIQRIKRSSALLVVAGHHSLRSKWVALECKTASEMGKRIIVVDRCKNFSQEPEQPVKHWLTDILRIPETLNRATPSQKVIEDSKKWFSMTRRATIRLTLASIFISILSILLIGVIGFYQRSEIERKLATSRKLAAEVENQLIKQPELLVESTQLALSALSETITLEAKQVLKKCLSLLPISQVIPIEHGQNGLSGLTFGKNDSLMALAGYEHSIWIYNYPKMEILDSLKHPNRVEHITFHKNGQLLAAAGSDYDSTEVVIYNLKNKQIIATLPHPESIYTTAWHPTLKILATACTDGVIRFWQLDTKPRIIYQQTYSKSVNSVSFTKGGQWIIIGGNQLIEVRNWKSQQVLFSKELDASVETVELDLSNNFLVAGSLQGNIWVWDFNTKELIWSKQILNEMGIHRISIYQDSTKALLATASSDKTARVWSLKEGVELYRIPFAEKVEEVQFIENGTKLASISYDNHLVLSKMKESAYQRKLLLPGKPKKIIYTTNQGEFFYDTNNQHFGLGNSEKGAIDKILFREGYSYTIASDYLPKQKKIVRYLGRKKIQIYDLNQGQKLVLKTDSIQGKRVDIKHLRFSPSGTWVCGATKKEIMIWDAASGQLVYQNKWYQKQRQLNWLGNNQIVFLKNDSTFVQYDLTTHIITELKVAPSTYCAIQSSTDRHIIVMRQGRNKLSFFRWQKGKLNPIYQFQDKEGFSRFFLHPSKMLAAVQTYDNHITVLNTKEWTSWKFPTAEFVGELLSFSKDGQFLGLVENSNICSIWSIPNQEKLLQWQTPSEVQTINLHPNQPLMFTCCVDNYVYEWTWDISTLQLQTKNRLQPFLN